MGTSQTSPAKLNYRGLDLEKTSHLRSRQNFFLDIPFDRTQPGPSHSGTENCRHHLNHVEERSEFRPQTVAATNRLSITEEETSIRRVSSASG